MQWNSVVNKVTPYVVKIETPDGHGTGFLCLYNNDRTFCGIATALHVVANADTWQQPIRLHHHPSSQVAFLKEGERIIIPNYETDSAIILVWLAQIKEFNLPQMLIPLLPSSTILPIGTEIGWLGYPAIAQHTLCFFSGIVSARQERQHAYLLDGVAINGVSGGPVVHSTDADGVQIIGTLSAYISNRATGDTLPGLSIARDVSHFHDTIGRLNSLEEAQRKKEEQKEQQAQPETISLPSDRPNPTKA
ncbi:MAG: trypsin-like peptidase domain-containing protein [Nitrospirae bacterium]|nr:trypsin-like peptidase domain-containing protein [Nitrospirota bacterium]